MSPKRAAEDPVQQEVERLMEMLRIFVRTLGYGNTEIARRTKIAHANVGRYFRGEARVPLDFLIAVVHALGLEFWEFFDLAYAERPAQPSAARQKIERILQILPAPRPAPAEEPEREPEKPPALTRAEVEKMIDDLRQLMGELLEAKQSTAAPPEPRAGARARAESTKKPAKRRKTGR